MEPVTIVVAALNLAASIVYGYVGRLIIGRRLEGPAAVASKLFGVWWISLAIVSVLGFIPIIGGVLQIGEVAFYLAYLQLVILIIVIAIWALVYYLVFLLTGKSSLFTPIAIYFGLVWVLFIYAIATIHYSAVDFTASGAVLHPDSQIARPVALALSVTLIAPPLVAALGYFRLFFRVKGATPRYRIGLVSITFVLWFLSSAVGSALPAGTTQTIPWRIFTGLLGVAAAIAILFAYRPPAWVRRKYGIEAVDEHTDEPA